MTIKQYWFSEEGLNKIYSWARRGLTNEEIAQMMDVTGPTFYSYMKEINFFNNIKKARDEALIQVENAMFKKALGYIATETVEEYDKNSGVMIETKKITRDVPPDLGAQIFILKNRLPKAWRDKIVSNEDQEAINKVEKMLVNIKQVANGIGND